MVELILFIAISIFMCALVSVAFAALIAHRDKAKSIEIPVHAHSTFAQQEDTLGGGTQTGMVHALNLPGQQRTMVVSPAPFASYSFQVKGRPEPQKRAMLAEDLEKQLRQTREPIEKIRIATELSRLGGAKPAQMLIDAIRDGVISPAAGAQVVSSTGFSGGLITGVAFNDPDPRVSLFVRLIVEGVKSG